MFEKLVSFTKDVSDLADKPALNASELKAQFDAAPNEVREYLNKLIDALKLTTGGDSGLKNIGATNITGLTGSDGQTLLESIKTLVDKKVEGNGQHVQVGRVGTLTVPAGQTYVFDFLFSTPYGTGAIPIITVTPNGSITNCSNLKHSTTLITNTGFRLEIKNTGAVDEYAFYNWIAIA